MELHSPLNPAKSNNEIISVIDHPYLAKSHLHAEAETNTYRNELLHPAKRTTAAQSSLSPITRSYRFFTFPTQENNTGCAMSVTYTDTPLSREATNSPFPLKEKA